MGKKPTIRVIRNMARSGGTLIGKCIGCMDRVVLLSEIHPGNLRVTNPMLQAQKWFELIDNKDITRWKQSKGPTMMQFVTVCQSRAAARGETLVLRDWSHLDYNGTPFVEPSYGFGLGDALSAGYEIREISTTRHPVDQYLSMQSFPGMKDLIPIDAYLHGCAAFAEYASEHGFVRYEDFVADPDTKLREICDALDLAFDASYHDKWSSYATITGDNMNPSGRASASKEIRPMERKAIDEALLDRLRSSDKYSRVCELLGYDE